MISIKLHLCLCESERLTTLLTENRYCVVCISENFSLSLRKFFGTVPSVISSFFLVKTPHNLPLLRGSGLLAVLLQRLWKVGTLCQDNL